MDSKGGPHFQRFVAAGNPVGEIIAINNFLVEIRGLQPVNVHALVVFEDGSRGFEDVTPFGDDCSCTLCIMYGKFGQHFKMIDIKGKESSLVKRFILKE